jgi:hypothetical protein
LFKKCLDAFNGNFKLFQLAIVGSSAEQGSLKCECETDQTSFINCPDKIKSGHYHDRRYCEHFHVYNTPDFDMDIGCKKCSDYYRMCVNKYML